MKKTIYSGPQFTVTMRGNNVEIVETGINKYTIDSVSLEGREAGLFANQVKSYRSKSKKDELVRRMYFAEKRDPHRLNIGYPHSFMITFRQPVRLKDLRAELIIAGVDL